MDLTLPGRLPRHGFPLGKTHLISHTINELKLCCHRMGFSQISGPEIEDDWHNFTALNINDDHPARQMHDTFYTDIGSPLNPQNTSTSLLLRTHTSTMQIRHMMANCAPPIRIASIGKVYRADHDATHSPMFHQMELLCVEKDINLAHLKGTIESLLQLFFSNTNLKLRFRISYFPFTEPSLEVDIQYDSSDNKTRISDSDNTWLEILGAGMVHHQVLTNVGINPKEYTGFALGIGIERIAMLKHGITDLRNFYQGDIRWLHAYSIL